MKLAEITADQIEMYLRLRLRQRKRVRTLLGFVEHGLLRPATVHQEFRVLRRILNVAMKKRMCAENVAAAAEFPTTVKGLFRPHYMSWSEQQRIETAGPQYLCNLIRIIAR